jgi:hypothetical protein
VRSPLEISPGLKIGWARAEARDYTLAPRDMLGEIDIIGNWRFEIGNWKSISNF